MTTFIYKLFLSFLLLTTIACNKQKYNQQNTLVPYTKVNFSITSPAFISAAGIGNYEIVYGQGNNGIIVYNINGSQFKAFDLACPYLNPNDCKTPMKVDKGGEMSCAGCSEDEITFTQFKTGVTINGTQYYLREYYAYLDSGGLRITNY